jgi:CBS domain-containing protein
MTREVLTVGADWPVDRLAEFLTNHSISGAPVVDDGGTPVGVVSLTDVVRSGAYVERATSHAPASHARGLELVAGREAALRVDLPSETLTRDIMTPVVFSVDEQATVQEVAHMMVTGRIHRVLVTRAGKIVGIISSLDLLPLVVDERPPS